MDLAFYGSVDHAPPKSTSGRNRTLRVAGIAYDKVIAADGSPFPFLRKGSREELFKETGTKKLPVMKLPDGTVLVHDDAIIKWAREQGAKPHAHP